MIPGARLIALLPLALSLSGRPLTTAAVETRSTRWENGSPSTRRTYVGGREEGRHIGWWDDGTIRFVFDFRDGLMEGTAREWFRDGRLYRETHYRRGQEEGMQRMWWPDGTLRASYVVRDGRRYGLLGAKGCVTLDTVDSGGRR